MTDNATFHALPGPLPISRGLVDADQWVALAEQKLRHGGRLVALWGSDHEGAQVHAAYADADGLQWLTLNLTATADTAAPDLSGFFSFAGRMQRATTDLLGIAFKDASDLRPWLDHGVWPERAPLRHGALAAGDSHAATLPTD